MTNRLQQTICCPSAQIAVADFSTCKHAPGLMARAVQRGSSQFDAFLLTQTFTMHTCRSAMQPPTCLCVMQILDAHVTPKHYMLVHTVAIHPLSTSCAPPLMHLWAIQTSNDCCRLCVMHTTTGFACRLLAWATDIEAQLGSQRQELRRSRVELASAQEVAPPSLAITTDPNDQEECMMLCVCVHAL